MMWRTPPDASLTLPRRTAGRLSRRRDDRRRLSLVADLRGIARRAGTASRPRQFDVLLRNRAALVRPQLLQVAATLERVNDPDPETLRTLRRLLTDGCASPLFNAGVPTGVLTSALDRVRLELEAREARDAREARALRAPLPERPAPGRVRGVYRYRRIEGSRPT